MKKLIFGLGMILVIALVVGCVGTGTNTNGTNGTNVTKNGSSSSAFLGVEVPRYSSCSAIKDSFKANLEKSRIRGSVYDMISAQTTATGAAEKSNGAVPLSAQSGTADYSQTNVQIQGVDEADIIKTDGKYVYAIAGGKLQIARAYPAKEMEVLSTTKINGNPYEIFISGNHLLVFSRTNGKVGSEINDETEGETKKASGAPAYYRPYYYGYTSVELYDVSDRTEPKLLKSAEFEGDYISSRMINGTAYFVIRDNPIRVFEKDGEEILPVYREGSGEQNGTNKNFTPMLPCGTVGYLPPVQADAFVILGSISLDKGDLKKEVIVASGQNIYSSEGNLYLAEVKYDYGWTNGNDLIPVPMPMPAIDVNAIVGKVMRVPTQRTYEEKTIVHKIALTGNGTMKYVGSGSAPGHILNQFSMDEYDGKFRIATTKGQNWQSNQQSSSNVYVFDNEMKIIGRLEGLAPGESIYSVRFMGKRAYIVTFKKVDPLFVIDMENPHAPKVLGKLKIPGYSNYLHPIDENHLIGVGKDTEEAEGGNFAWYQGIKMAIFDVSDVEHPKEMHKVIIGDRGTDSYALTDHKAFLYDKEKNLLVLPVLLAEIDESVKESEGGSVVTQQRWGSMYGSYVFQGAYVYDLSLERGFVLRGRITHQENTDVFDKSGYYYGGGNYDVKRSLYIGNTLYTFSEGKLMANSLEDLHKIKEVEWN